MIEKKVYVAPKMELVALCGTDIITASGYTKPNDDGFSQYYPDPVL